MDRKPCLKAGDRTVDRRRSPDSASWTRRRHSFSQRRQQNDKDGGWKVSLVMLGRESGVASRAVQQRPNMLVCGLWLLISGPRPRAHNNRELASAARLWAGEVFFSDHSRPSGSSNTPGFTHESVSGGHVWDEWQGRPRRPPAKSWRDGSCSPGMFMRPRSILLLCNRSLSFTQSCFYLINMSLNILILCKTPEANIEIWSKTTPRRWNDLSDVLAYWFPA